MGSQKPLYGSLSLKKTPGPHLDLPHFFVQPMGEADMKHVYNCTGYALKIPNIVSSLGMYVLDDQGRQYMDLESGVWCTCLGHAHPAVNRVITEQINSLMHAGYCYSHQILDQASRAVLDIAGFDHGKCVFLCSGSEAIEISRQISRHLSGNSISMTLHDSYLGSYASVTNRDRDWYMFNWDYCRTCKINNRCDPFCNAFEDMPAGISDFTFEPGSSSGFVRFPPKALIHNLIIKVHDQNGKVIANEVTTGLGRTGEWFGYEHYGIQPDMVAMGKGIGNGYPVSAACISRGVLDELDKRPFRYVQSHQNDPLGAAVALKVIQVIRETKLINKAKHLGEVFLKQLQSLVDGRVITGARGRGLMLALDLVDHNTAEVMHNDLIKQSFIVGNRGATFRIDPALIVTEEEFSRFIVALDKAGQRAGKYSGVGG
jgi:acetylornithine/N-succinyldiaminopimelate aminotransferase